MGEREREERERQREPRQVKVTDKRRVHMEADPPSPEGPADLAAGQPSGAEGPGLAEPGSGQENEADASDLEAARREASEYRERLQRMAADFDNARKRMVKDQTRAVEMASQGLILRLLEVLDEFQLALIAADQKPEFEKFLRGVELVYGKLQEIMRGEGLERIDAEGKPFDPTRHEALMQAGHGDGEPVVTDVLRQGYTLKGRVVRPAGVKVSRGE